MEPIKYTCDDLMYMDFEYIKKKLIEYSKIPPSYFDTEPPNTTTIPVVNKYKYLLIG